MSGNDDASRWLAERAKEMEDEVADLVSVNSFTENRDGGRVVGELLRQRTFAVAGVESLVHPSAKFAPHLVFRTKGDPRRAPLALIGHLDTVFPPGMFEGYRRDGDLARGPGVLDMKGGLVVVAWALRAIAETVGIDAIAPLRIAVVSDEEVGSPEGQGIIREAIAGAKAALVFESGRKADAIITRRKGTGGMTARAIGKAAHAGNNHRDGANAIWALARFVDRVQKLTAYDRGVSVNVGTIHGGTSKNTVPESAEAKLDLRFETTADAEALVAAVHEAAVDAAAEVPGTTIELDGGIARLPMERSDASVKLMDVYGACARGVGLGASEALLIGGGSDASTSSAMGIASIEGLGPRRLGFQTKDEQIEIAKLVLKAQALAHFFLVYGVGV
ncbi:M20 family metallopeptidase [soil metagenome]